MILILYKLCLTVMVVAAIVGSIAYKKMIVEFRWIFYTLLLAIITEAAGYWAGKKFGDNRMIFALANPLETISYIIFFTKILNRKMIKRISLIAGVLMLVLSLINVFFFKGVLFSSFYLIIAKGVIITILCIIYLFRLLASENPVRKVDTGILIIITGLLFYYSFSAILFALWNYQINHKLSFEITLSLRPFLHVVYLIFQISILYTFANVALMKKPLINAY